MLAAGAALLVVIWGVLFFSPGSIPISVSALTFGMCTPAVWEVTERIGNSQLARYVESPNSLVFILSLFGLSGAGLYFGAREYLNPSLGELTGQQRRLVKQIRAEGLALDEQLVATLKWLQTFIDANDEYSETLRRARKDLESQITAERVDAVISYLLAKNAEMQRESADLKDRLEQSQKQVRELREKLSEALDMGLRDPLTDLGNRRRFDLALAEEVAQARMNGNRLSLVLCDLDHFKKINDRFGHQVGDSVLRLFANLLVKNVKGRDTAVRYGGEEFALILPDTGVEGARNVTESIRRDLEASNWRVTATQRPIGRVTASFGIAELKAEDGVQQLIERADRRLYTAKTSGRNRVNDSSL